MHNEAFLINVFENEADLFKYGNISGNSIKFYIILAQFANQIKLHEIKRIMSEQENAYFPFKLDMRKFSSLYPTDDVEYELAARGSVKDVVDLFTKYNQSASSLGDVDLANEESSDEDLSEFDKIISAHLDNKSNYETNFQRVLEKRNPDRLL